MKVSRCPENPIIEPKDVKPSREDFEVVGVFNAGAARLSDGVVLLLRAAERPVSGDASIVLTAAYDVDKSEIVLKEFSRDDSANDFSDPRLIVRRGQTYSPRCSSHRVHVVGDERRLAYQNGNTDSANGSAATIS